MLILRSLPYLSSKKQKTTKDTKSLECNALASPSGFFVRFVVYAFYRGASGNLRIPVPSWDVTSRLPTSPAPGSVRPANAASVPP